MSFGPAFDAKEQVRQAVDIVDLVGSYIQLRRQGRNFVGLCPWHDDSRPSLQVNPDRQSFKCWVCDYRRRRLQLRDAGGGPGVPRSAGTARRTRRHRTAPASITTASRAVIRRVDPKTTSARSTASSPGPKSNSTAASSHAPKANPAAGTSPTAASRAETISQFHLGFAPNRWDWILERARGTRMDAAAFSNASACCAAKSWAAATTIGSAAA